MIVDPSEMRKPTPRVPAQTRHLVAANDAMRAHQMTLAFVRIFGAAPEIIAAAPGRIEIVGNHTDYNGGPVIGAAINRETCVAVARRGNGRCRFATETELPTIIDASSGTFERRTGHGSWTNYVVGVLQSLGRAGIAVPSGFDLYVSSTLPVGAGLSSSAALELATAFAFLGLAQASLPKDQIAILCREAENLFVGVPCGLLDQAVSTFGQENHLVMVDCGGPRFSLLRMPPGAHFWVFNTHTRHALVDGLYAARHRECMEAAQALGVPLLSDATAELLADSPGRMPVQVYRRAGHVIDEIARVRQMSAILQAGNLATVGRILSESHASSQMLFENSTAELDFLVSALTAMPDVYGARLTGGGFGGAVMAVTNETFDKAAAEVIAARYAERFQTRPDVLHLRTSNGARVLRNTIRV